MKSPILSLFIFFSVLVGSGGATRSKPTKCRNVPGNPGFPSDEQWSALNSTISGRLVKVVPSAKFCHSLPEGSCTFQQWTSSVFRNEIPGAMNQVNWEQDYDSNPPSLCQQNSSTCDQGNVPLFAVVASTASDIQAGINFSHTHNLRLAIKASGHDYLGRSTAKSSLLIWTHKLQDIKFTDNFVIAGKSKGSAVTVGSGVTLNTLYGASKEAGKIFVGGTAATVVAAGGFIQGGGHSALSPKLGMAVDHLLELQVVLADGRLVNVNCIDNPDLFWAMRGGGAGSWGVIVSATFQTFPTFNVTFSGVKIFTNTSKEMGDIATLHAKHIFDWDPFRVGQYFYVLTGVSSNATAATNIMMLIATYFPTTPVEQAAAALKPFLDGARSQGAFVQEQNLPLSVNDILFNADDDSGHNIVMGSRLIPPSTYRDRPEEIGQVYTKLLEGGTANVLGHLVAGGKVSENAHVDSALNPKWRTAKTHPDSASPQEVTFLRHAFRDKQLPLLKQLAGPDSGSYSNEADALEHDFQRTFYGPNYARLSKIKKKYDPHHLFIVAAGVGSEDWDELVIIRNIRNSLTSNTLAHIAKCHDGAHRGCIMDPQGYNASHPL